jgi:predicted methyltransferase
MFAGGNRNKELDLGLFDEVNEDGRVDRDPASPLEAAHAAPEACQNVLSLSPAGRSSPGDRRRRHRTGPRLVDEDDRVQPGAVNLFRDHGSGGDIPVRPQRGLSGSRATTGRLMKTRTLLMAPLLAMVFFEASVPARPASPQQPAIRPLAAAVPPQRKPRLFRPEDLGLLEAPDRDDWNKPDVIMDSLGIADGAVVADLGAGGGWFTIRLARRVGPNGVVYAQDIQPQMIEAINRRMQHEGVNNVRTVMGTSTDPRLPVGIDVVLIVDAYHEMEDPVTLLRNVARSLKPQGRVGVVDFLPGGGGPGPSAEDRVNPEAVIGAAEAAGLLLQKREVVPPFQFVLIFGKAFASARKAP